MLSRRRFLKTGALVSLSPLVPRMLTTAARAAADAAADAADERVLVVIQLDGGNDGINTVVPFTDEGYPKYRKSLRLASNELHRLTDDIGLHPSMRGARELFDNGQLTIVQGVGYPNPSRSHFRSMRIWQTAHFRNEQLNGYGWLGRALDADQHALNQTSDAIYVGEQELPVALWGRRAAATTLLREDDMKLSLGLTPDAAATVPPADGSLAQFVAREVLAAYATAGEFSARAGQQAAGSATGYPSTELGERLRLIARLLCSGSQARVYYTLQTGYDTHSDQLGAHARLLGELSAALKAFIDELAAAGLDDRVVVMTFSEFGRRVEENGSQGTDHGTAGPVLLAGSPVAGGLVGTAPSLLDLEDGDLKSQLDFRRIYATLLERWLGVSPRGVLDDVFEPLPLFSA